jgi:MerR family transcriptional regulator, light-induced transcriptional regulator
MDRDQRGVHPIGVVAKRTGLSLHVLRAWERRYGAVRPVRTEGGQRLYTEADVERLRRLRRAVEAGRSISQVARLSGEELARLTAADEEPGTRREPKAGGYVEAALSAGERLDGDGVYGSLLRGVVSLGTTEFLDLVLQPVLEEVGRRWHEGQLGPSQEHVVSQAVRRVLWWMVEASARPSGPVVVLTTVAGEQHEFGVLAAAAVAQQAGWRAAYLGASLPATEIARAAVALGGRAVGVSVVNTGAEHAGLVDEALAVRGLVATEVTVLAGGAGAEQARGRLEAGGVVVVTDLQRLPGALPTREPVAR